MTRIIIAVLGLALAGVVFFGYTKPTYDTITTLNSQGKQYDEALQKASELQQLKQSLLSRYNALNPSDLNRLQGLLPDHVDNVRLILDLDHLASRYGLGLENVVVDNAQVDNSTRTTAGVIGGQTQAYDSLTLKFSTRGTYANFRAFLKDLETSLRVVDLEELQMQQAGLAANAAVGEPLYQYNLTIRTYWLK